MRERPILFTGEMVRKILAGEKTQTRRVIALREFQPSTTGAPYDWQCRDKRGLWNDYRHDDLVAKHCPYGKPGDRLWVRETWGVCHEHADKTPWSQQLADARAQLPWAPVAYRATDTFAHGGPWKPSIHMPRWASRLTLEVTGVRVERLQDISFTDAVAEGISDHNSQPHPIRLFEALWDSINAARGYSWESDPYVWVVEFKREGKAGG